MCCFWLVCLLLALFCVFKQTRFFSCQAFLTFNRFMVVLFSFILIFCLILPLFSLFFFVSLLLFFFLNRLVIVVCLFLVQFLGQDIFIMYLFNFCGFRFFVLPFS